MEKNSRVVWRAAMHVRRGIEGKEDRRSETDEWTSDNTTS